MKKIYSFELSKTEIKEEPVIEKNDNGEEIKVLRKIEHKIPQKYFIKKPGRVLTEAADLYYNSQFWAFVKAGILPSSQLQKRYLDDEGVLSKDQRKEYNELYDKLFQKQAAHRALNSKTEKLDDDKKESEKIMNEIVEIMSTLQSFESKTSAELYQNTAENLARNKTALFWTLMLSEKELENDKSEPVFGKGEFEDRLKKYDEFEAAEDPFTFELIQRLLLVTSLWFFGKAETQEDFDLLLKVSENSDLLEATKTLGIKEEVKEEIKEKTFKDEKAPEIAPKLEEVKV